MQLSESLLDEALQYHGSILCQASILCVHQKGAQCKVSAASA